MNETLYLLRESQFALDCWVRGGENWTHEELSHYFGEATFDGAVAYANALVGLSVVWEKVLNNNLSRRAIEGAVSFLTNENPDVTKWEDGSAYGFEITGSFYQIDIRDCGFGVYNAAGEEVSVTTSAAQAVYEAVMLWVSGE